MIIRRAWLVLCLLLIPSFAWVGGLSFRKPINISIGSNQTDYTARRNFTYELNMRANFGDVQPAWPNDTFIPFRIVEKVDGAWALIDFKGNWNTYNGTQAYLYYGDAGASTASSGNNTYLFWDDFLGTSLSGDWDNNGGTLNGTGTVVIDGTDYINLTGLWGTGLAFTTRAYVTEQDQMFIVIGDPEDTPSDISYNEKGIEVIHTDGGGEQNYTQTRLRTYDSGQESNYMYSPDVRTYQTYEIQRQGTGQVNYWINRRSYFNSTTEIPDDNFAFMVGEYGDASETIIDYVYIRKYIYPEPIVTVGAEKSNIPLFSGISSVPTYPYVNQTVTTTVTWDVAYDYANFWWNFGDGNITHSTTIDWGYCYQETANVSTGCGGLATGAYEISNISSYYSNQYPWLAYDGNFSTYWRIDSVAFTNEIMWVNYTQPTNVVNGTTLQTRIGDDATTNYSVPDTCMAPEKLQLQFNSTTGDGGVLWNYSITVKCWDGASWNQLAQDYYHGQSRGGYLYEEGIYWKVAGLTDSSTINHIYSTPGTYVANVSGYEAGYGLNATATVNITVYARLSATNITITDYLPFLFWNATHVLGISTTGGTPNLNNSWAITLPNSSLFYYVNESPLSFSPPIEGTYAIALTVCDLTDGACVSDSDSYRAWNVSGGVFLVDGFNVSDLCLSEIFLGDSVTFSSGDQSLNWAMNGWTSIGTSASPTFSSSYAYWNDDNYYHFNVTLNTSWGNYTSSGWFTVSAATYTLRAGACETNETGYCWVWGELYDEATFAEIGDATTDWDFYSVTSDYYGHEQEESVNATAADLNVTWCSNATPLLDHMLVNAMLTYSLENYTTRIYAWDNATFDFVGTCSYVNSHKYKFYTVSNITTSSVTFTVTQGGEALEDALLQIQAFHDSTWVTIASQLTDSSGQAQFDIHLCPTYYKFVVLGGGSILYSDKDCVETTSYTIEVGEDLDEFFSVWYDISTSCSYDETDEYVACTISDPTGLTVVSTLNVTTALDYSETAVCEVSEASGTTTLVCSVAGEPAGDYAWLLTITTSSGTYKINSGGFTIYGDILEFEDKGIVAFATILILLLATRLPPEATIMISVGGFLAVRMMGLITTSYMAVGWVLALGAVGIMRVVKGG